MGSATPSDSRPIDAEINGGANIIKKAVPNADAEGIKGVVVRPVRVTLLQSSGVDNKIIVYKTCNY